MKKPKIPAENFCQTLVVNVGNPRLSDHDFRELVRRTIDKVQFERTENILTILSKQK